MSNNLYNIIVPVPFDTNTYAIKDLNIEFMIGFKKEHNEFLINRLYNYQPLENTNGAYPIVEFERKYPNGYIKLKGKDLWLYEKDNKPYFDLIKCGDFAEKQPMVIWFEYVREREVIVYKLLGYNVESVMKKTYEKLKNQSYMNYKQIGDGIYINWVDDINKATKFSYDKIKWNEISWIKLHDKNIQHKLLSRHYEV